MIFDQSSPKGILIMCRSLRLISMFILIMIHVSGHAADMNSIREKCIAYGAAPGSSGFFNCMSELDKNNDSNEQYQAALKNCDSQILHWRLQGSAMYFDSSGSSSRQLQGAEIFSNEKLVECRREAAEVYKGVSGNRRVCTTDSSGQTVCENR